MNAHSASAGEATKTHIEHLASLEDLVGEELGVSPWIPISQDRINAFAQASDDHQWIHVDPDRAALESPFTSTIAQGFLILSLLPRVCYQTLTIENVSMAINYGLDKVRFISPVPVDSEIRGRVVLDDFDMRGRKGQLKLGITFEIKNKTKPACVAKLISQVLVQS